MISQHPATHFKPRPDGGARPEVSVVIPFYNAEKFIRPCLASLERLDHPAYEIIAVDNASNDKSLHLLKEFRGVKICREPRRGSYRARNTGARAASGNILAFTDIDCLVARDWLKQIGASCRRREAAQGPTHLTRDRGLWVRLESVRAKIVTTGAINTRNFAIRRDVFERLGGFEAGMPNGADTLFGITLQRHGISVEHNKRMRVYHHWENNPRHLFSKIDGYARGDYLLYVNHGYWKPLTKKLAKTAAIPYTALKQAVRSGLPLDEKIFYLVYKTVYQLVRDLRFYRLLVRHAGRRP
jgi:glycosyltransferase involved in cell wall biosynthesis